MCHILLTKTANLKTRGLQCMKILCNMNSLPFNASRLVVIDNTCTKFLSNSCNGISGIFRVGLIFTEFATPLKLPKIDTAKNKPYNRSSLRVLEIAKEGLGEKLTHLPSVISAKICRREKFPIYGKNCTGKLRCVNSSRATSFADFFGMIISF